MAYENAAGINVTGVVAADGAGAFNGRTVTGTTDFIDVATGDGVSGNPTISIGQEFEETGMHAWNGSILETADVTVTSDGATITCSVEKSGTGNLTVVFSDGYYEWITAPDTVTLSAGSDTSPTQNFIYFLQSNKTLTASTVSFPATEHSPIATVICQSAASLQTNGAYKVHVWTDHVVMIDEQGHISDLNSWIRHQNATWSSGVGQTFTITPNGGAADNVILTTASGVVLQLHDHAFPAFGGTPDVYVINDSVTPYDLVTDLNALLTDSQGVSMSGRYFSLVIWGVISQDSGDSKLYCNLPSGSYNNSAGVEQDLQHFADYSIPTEFKGTGFLIAEWKLRNQPAASGTWTSIEEIDLRGQIPSIAVGGGAAISSEFVDNVFRIIDDGDNTKKIAFQADTVTTATTRTITAANYDIDMATLSNSFPSDSGTATPALGVLTVTGGTGVNTSGATSVVTVNIDSPVIVANGGTGVATLTGILTGNGTSAVTASTVTDNTVIMGSTSNGVQDTTITVSDAGEMVNTSQPAFGAYLATQDDDVTGNNLTYSIGTNVAWTERFDQNSDFNTNGTFTAPVTGKYCFQGAVRMVTTSMGSSTSTVQFITTSNEVYRNSFTYATASEPSVQTNMSVLADLDVGDTAILRISVNGIGANTADVAASANPWTFFTGALIC